MISHLPPSPYDQDFRVTARTNRLSMNTNRSRIWLDHVHAMEPTQPERCAGIRFLQGFFP